MLCGPFDVFGRALFVFHTFDLNGKQITSYHLHTPKHHNTLIYAQLHIRAITSQHHDYKASLCILIRLRFVTITSSKGPKQTALSR